MNGIIGMNQLALDTSLTEDQRDYIGTAQACSIELLEMLDGILDLSRIEAGKFDLETVEFDVRDCVEGAARLLLRQAFDKGLKLSCNIPEDVPRRLSGDPTRLRQVLVNLVGNAIKFTENGEVEVKIEAAPENNGRVTLNCAVRDTGVGIALDRQDEIFKSFVQEDGSTTRKYGGTGLGLAISMQIVEMMHGSIEVDSTPGRGSTFRFSAVMWQCEISDGESPPKGNVVTSSEAASQSLTTDGRSESEDERKFNARVLLVEDNHVNIKLGLSILNKFGCKVTVAKNGQVALEVLARESFDLVFMDLQMPDMGGLEATALIREMEQETGNHVPIVALTAHAMPGDREKCLSAGMDGYLSKPIMITEVRDTLEQWIGQPLTC